MYISTTSDQMIDNPGMRSRKDLDGKGIQGLTESLKFFNTTSLTSRNLLSINGFKPAEAVGSELDLSKQSFSVRRRIRASSLSTGSEVEVSPEHS